MKWLTNIYDPRREDAPQQVIREHGESREQAWRRQEASLEGKVLGKPMGTEHASVERLEEWGYVGVYES